MGMCFDVQIYEYIKHKASFPLYAKFKINRFELTFLMQLSAILRHYNKQIINKDDLFSGITGNVKEFRKFEGYLKGCRDKGFIGSYEYISKPGSLSLGISDLGLSVLRMYNREIEQRVELWRASEEKRDSLPTSLTLVPPLRHIERQHIAA